MVAHVPGVNIRHESKRAARGELAWGVFVDVRFEGKRYSPSKFFATEAEAEAHYPAAAAEVTKLREELAREAALKQALAVPPLPQAPKGTLLFETLALRWLEEECKPPRKTAATYVNYQGLLKRHLLPIMRAWPVNDEVLSKKRLKEVLKTELHAKKVSLTTRVSCQRCLSALFTWALSELPPKQLQINPAMKLGSRLLRQDDEVDVRLRQEPNPMTRDQVEAFLTWQQEHRPALYEFFLWLADEGSRIGEVCALKWEHVDLTHGKAHIIQAFSHAQRKFERQQARTGIGEKDTKTHRSNQYVDLSDRVVAALAALKSTNLERWMKRGRYGRGTAHVFLNSDLQPRRPDRTVYQSFRKACDALALKGQTGKPFTIHCLRDTFATLAILEGKLDLGWVAMMLGHANEETLKAHYYKWVRLVAANPLAGIKR
jgi:integrase